MRVEATIEGKTSGRDYIIMKLWSFYTNTSILQQIFGAGFARTLSIAGNYAHNDWIEMLIDCGFVGLLLYGLFYVALIRRIIFSIDKVKRLLSLLFIAFFPTSFYSMVFFSESSSIGFLWLGFAIGLIDLKRSVKSNKVPVKNNYQIESNLIK